MRHVSQTSKSTASAPRARTRTQVSSSEVTTASIQTKDTSVVPSPAGDATRDAAAQQRELREHVIEFRKERARIDEESDFLLRHIGLRTLSAHTDERGFNPDCLEHAEDQAFVRLLLNTLKKDVLRSLNQLNEDERVDLDTLDDCANSAHALQVAQEEVRNAEQWAADTQAELNRLRREYEVTIVQSRKAFDGLLHVTERPLAVRRMGALLAVFGVCALAWLLVRGDTGHGRWAETVTLGLGGLSLAGFGFHLSRSVVARRNEMKAKLEALSSRLEEAVGVSTTAQAMLETAVARCQRAEVDFLRDEKAAIDVAHRRPGVVQYVTQDLQDNSGSPQDNSIFPAPTL